MAAPRRYVVYGAGAVGCGLGGALQLAGAPVVLVARGAQLEALRRAGLLLAMPSRSVQLGVQAVGSASEIRYESRDVILLCTKSQDSTAALLDLSGAAPEDVPIVCAQNGVANEPLAAQHFANVYAMLVFSPFSYLEPGRVTIHTEPLLGALDLGRYPRGTDALAAEVVRDLAGAGFEARCDSRVMRLKYGKLLTNLGNAVQALGGGDAFGGSLLERLHEEALLCYCAAGIDYVPMAEINERYSSVGDLPVLGEKRRGGSSWQSLARRTGTLETDHLNGEIVRLGERLGIPTPLNRAIVEIARRAAAEQWEPGRLTAGEMEAALYASVTS